ncbi:FAST kinase domain-containing protein 3, mitochondrial [Papilio machaon]|uniref:FAST kinase domain-containing protein 3, mitochondrial n=1 Tax=Papilio machaon TaxID=76193 RepID=UPI001E663328|nr:FAST kinase domain-containing protein 3, mitochondrial [Papilio machaon]
MSLVFRRSYIKFRKSVQICGNSNCSNNNGFIIGNRSFSDDKLKNHDFTHTTILIENGYNVQELPIVIRKLNDIGEFENVRKLEPPNTTSDSLNYNLIQAEFKQCTHLRDVFSLITKCSKITPNIALAAIERIYDLEKITTPMVVDIKPDYISDAKGAILEKLLRVVIRTEDTNTILNILKTDSSLLHPYKHKFCDEVLNRVIDNKLTLDQICNFTKYLIKNNVDPKYSETIDKMWVGFIEKEDEIDETNIDLLFKILPGLKSSKRTIIVLLEQKLSDYWYKIKVSSMQDILEIFLQVKYFSLQSFAIVGSWFNRNIHVLDEDTLLDIITKLTRLNYTDYQVEKAVERYMKYKESKIKSHVLIVAILNYCMQFKIRNKDILNVCGNYLINNINNIPASFLKCCVYPYGYLNFQPDNKEFCTILEKNLLVKFDKMNVDDLSSIALSFIYIGQYPFQLVNRMFSSEYLTKISNQDIMNRLKLIDTALSLEAQEYPGPLLPKDHWLKPIEQDKRVQNILEKINDTFLSIVGKSMKISNGVLLPNFCSDQTYFIDIMIHPIDFGNNFSNWKSKYVKNKLTAVLVFLPDHYCSDDKTLIGPQMMRVKHLQLLGMKVVGLKYSQLSQLHTLYDKPGLKKYIKQSIENAITC